MDTVLVRVGEIALKSSPVRRRWIRKLVSDLKYFLDKNEVDYRLRREWGRIFIDTKDKTALKTVSKVFGVVSISPALMREPRLPTIKETCLKFAKQVLRGETFAVRARRAGKDYPFTSKDLEKELGRIILAEFPNLRVDLDNPDKTIYVEVRPSKAYIFDKKLKGVGGLPLGTQGRVVLWVEGRDSLVAGWLMMKRGCSLVPVYFDLGKRKVLQAVKKLRKWSSEPFKFITVPYEETLNKLKSYPKLWEILDKRLRVRLLNEIAKQEKATAVVTGETDLGRMRLVSFTKLPIFRPLVGLEETEISQLAKGITNLPKIKKKPIKVSIKEIERAEKELVIERLVERGIDNLETAEI